MNSCKYPFGYVMFVENTKYSKSSLYPFLDFLGQGFWIPIKGILSHPKVDRPCQDFAQGLARGQPKLHLRSPYYKSTVSAGTLHTL